MTAATGRTYDSPLREEQAAATRERILAGLAELVVAENPALLSMQDVARRARVSVRTIYRHFPTKEELYSALFVWATNIQAGAMPTQSGHVRSVDDLVALTRMMFERMGANLPLHRAIDGLPESRAARIKRAPRRRQLVADGMSEATAGLSPDAAKKVHAIAHLLTSSDALLFLEELWRLTPEEAADAATWALRVIADRAAKTKPGRGDL